MSGRLERIRPEDIPLALLVGLGRLTPGERDAWIDWNVLGVRETGASRQLVQLANKRLREFFGSPERLRDAA